MADKHQVHFMSESQPTPPKPGAIAWHDLTVPNAVEVRDFYAAVVGWKSQAVPMDGYDDFAMIPTGGQDAVSGICHARGTNADLPAQWLMYVIVENVEASVSACLSRGGAVVSGPRSVGGGQFAVIRDPAGAVFAVYQPG